MDPQIALETIKVPGVRTDREVMETLNQTQNTCVRMERGELPIRPPMGRLIICSVVHEIGVPLEELRRNLEAQRAATEARSRPKARSASRTDRRRVDTRRRS